jgi:flagellar hook assembly protein FlgD
MLRTILRATAFAVALLPAVLCAQSMVFHFTNGSTETFALSAIRKCTFVALDQVLWLADGTQYTWALDAIGKVEFPDISTGVTHIASGMEPLNLRLSPNPSMAEVNIATEMREAGRLVVEVWDAQGRVVRRLFEGELAAGPFQLQWDGTDGRGGRVAPATYLLRLVTASGSTAKPLIMY